MKRTQKSMSSHEHFKQRARLESEQLAMKLEDAESWLYYLDCLEGKAMKRTQKSMSSHEHFKPTSPFHEDYKLSFHEETDSQPGFGQYPPDNNELIDEINSHPLRHEEEDPKKSMLTKKRSLPHPKNSMMKKRRSPKPSPSEEEPKNTIMTKRSSHEPSGEEDEKPKRRSHEPSSEEQKKPKMRNPHSSLHQATRCIVYERSLQDFYAALKWKAIPLRLLRPSSGCR